MRLKTLFLLPLTTLALASCASNKSSHNGGELTAQGLYEKAEKAMNEELYYEATQLFEDVEREFPYSQLAKKAQLRSALASYEDERYDDALLAIDRFIQLHPGSEDLDYAYYLKALCNYDQITDVRRDQHMTKDALRSLETLINRFPNSPYARDAVLKRDLALDHLAGKEMEIGRYYLNRGHINAAINRFHNVIKQYQTTTHTAEALHRLVESYLTLGITPEALKIASVLGHNYPGSKWYQRSYDLLDEEKRQQLIDSQSRFDRTINSLFKPD